MLRLQSGTRDSNFYVSFSDLLFATMAIFVLLLFVVMGILGEEQKKTEAQAKDLAESLSSAAAERAAAREQLHEVVEKLAQLEQAVKAQGLEVAIAVDTSGSMGEALQHLLETITTISTVMPKVAPEFRIGIVGYCQPQPTDPGLQTFPLRRILPPSQDGGQSTRILFEFASSLKPSGGIAPVSAALHSAIGMFSDPRSFEGYQVLLVVGDTGPFETTANDWETVEPEEVAAASQLVRDIAGWAAVSDRRRVVSLFSGAGQRERPIKQQASREFFSRLASETGRAENFTENPGKMLAYLLTAIVPER